MKEDRKRRLVAILRNADTWVPASTLAKMLGVSTRTVRSYMAQLGKDYEVSSSQSGYRLASKAPRETTPLPANTTTKKAATAVPSTTDDASSRVSTFLSMLLSSHGSVSIFDAAEELCLSDSTVAGTVVPRARELAGNFDLKLASHDFALSLEGTERDKRRLLRFLVTQHSYGYFASTQTLAQMFPGFDVETIMAELVRICQESDLFLNNYTLNNLLVHVLVIVVRLEENHQQEGPDDPDLIDVTQLIERLRLHNQILRCADQIARMLERSCSIEISEGDFRQIVLLITLSTDQFDYESLNPATLSQLVDQPFYDSIRDIASHTAERYGLQPFDEDFVMQLTLHSYNAYQRALYGVSTPNPIGAQIKQSHPLVYDMAVFFCHRLERKLDVSLSEEEMAFFAFHFGAYLANHMNEDDRISCTIVAESYHGYAGRTTAAISDAFADDLSIGPTLGYDEFLQDPPTVDLVITTIPLVRNVEAHSPVHSVLVSPVIGRRDIKLIRNELELIRQERERSHARTFLRGMLRPELFVRNLKCSSVDAYIDYLGDLCVRHGYVGREFVQDVKLREHVSSTAFVEGLAIPHSINQFANKSFVCVLHNDEPIAWGRNNVNVVMMFGLSNADMHQLGRTFDIIVERFSTSESMRKVLASDGFDQFVTALLGSEA